MVSSDEKIKFVAEILKNKFDSSKLYLNHYTGKKKLKILEQHLGNSTISGFSVGD